MLSLDLLQLFRSLSLVHLDSLCLLFDQILEEGRAAVIALAKVILLWSQIFLVSHFWRERRRLVLGLFSNAGDASSFDRSYIIGTLWIGIAGTTLPFIKLKVILWCSCVLSSPSSELKLIWEVKFVQSQSHLWRSVDPSLALARKLHRLVEIAVKIARNYLARSKVPMWLIYAPDIPVHLWLFNRAGVITSPRFISLIKAYSSPVNLIKILLFTGLPNYVLFVLN